MNARRVGQLNVRSSTAAVEVMLSAGESNDFAF